MMIRMGMQNGREPKLTESQSESRRIADAGDGIHVGVRGHEIFRAQPLRRLSRRDSNKRGRRQRHHRLVRHDAGSQSIADHPVDALEAAGRLAQGSGRQAATVAQASMTIDHRDLEIPRQRVVL